MFHFQGTIKSTSKTTLNLLDRVQSFFKYIIIYVYHFKALKSDILKHTAIYIDIYVYNQQLYSSKKKRLIKSRPLKHTSTIYKY